MQRLANRFVTSAQRSQTAVPSRRTIASWHANSPSQQLLAHASATPTRPHSNFLRTMVTQMQSTAPPAVPLSHRLLQIEKQMHLNAAPPGGLLSERLVQIEKQMRTGAGDISEEEAAIWKVTLGMQSTEDTSALPSLCEDLTKVSESASRQQIDMVSILALLTPASLALLILASNQHHVP